MSEETTPRSSQDQALANRINQYRTTLTTAQANPELLDLLRPRGYDEVAFGVGLSRCDAAQTTFTARQNAIADRQEAAAAEKAARQAARDGFTDWRKTVRAVFRTNPAAQTALGATGRVPADQEKFLTLANASYTTALENSDYQTALTNRGYDPPAIQAEQAKLQALLQTSAAHEAAKGAAVRATAERDAAAKAMDEWWFEFRAIAQVALKDRPDLLIGLGL